MRMYDILRRKKNGETLSQEEICFFVNGYTAGEIPDYQASAFLMAVCWRGMDEKETAYLTDAMARSGDMADLSSIPGVKVDKHSTGGVGDKTSLIIGPIVAACGVPVAKMSGRGLGFSGGTIDKLEAIPGLETAIDRARFIDIVKNVGISIIGQSGNIAPADKKIYALRDVTATVESIPLIASSIMSKKLAAGSNAILLDVKTGRGAFMKTLDDSIALAKAMVSIGEHNGRRMLALITDMDVPLGHAIGNALEIIEVVKTLRGEGPADLTQVCIALAAHMLMLAGLGTIAHCAALAKAVLDDGSAFERLCAMVSAQGGDASYLRDTSLFPSAPVSFAICAAKGGMIRAMDAEAFGLASVLLGAGRTRKEDAIDFSAGIMLARKVGDAVQAGDVVATLYTSESTKLSEAEKLITDAIEIGAPPPPYKLLYARVSPEGVEML